MLVTESGRDSEMRLHKLVSSVRSAHSEDSVTTGSLLTSIADTGNTFSVWPEKKSQAAVNTRNVCLYLSFFPVLLALQFLPSAQSGVARGQDYSGPTPASMTLDMSQNLQFFICHTEKFLRLKGRSTEPKPR